MALRRRRGHLPRALGGAVMAGGGMGRSTGWRGSGARLPPRRVAAPRRQPCAGTRGAGPAEQAHRGGHGPFPRGTPAAGRTRLPQRSAPECPAPLRRYASRDPGRTSPETPSWRRRVAGGARGRARDRPHDGSARRRALARSWACPRTAFAPDGDGGRVPAFRRGVGAPDKGPASRRPAARAMRPPLRYAGGRAQLRPLPPAAEPRYPSGPAPGPDPASLPTLGSVPVPRPASASESGAPPASPP